MRTEAEKFKQDTRDAKEEKERMEIRLIDAQERLKLLETERAKFEGKISFSFIKKVIFKTTFQMFKIYIRYELIS